MSQDYVDNVYDSTFEVQTTMANLEKNFAALKSSFSGADAPSDPIAGIWWFDTTANILKLRNEANNAWQSVWDFANNKPVIANLSNEITNAMCAAALKDPVAATAGLRTLGTTAVKAAAGNDARFSTVPDGYVTNAKLSGMVAGDALIGMASSEHSTTFNHIYTKVKEIQIGQAGTLRIKFDLMGSGFYFGYGRVYRNGAAVGTEQSDKSIAYTTKSQDISGWSIGDLCQLYYKTEYVAGSSVHVKNFKIFSDYSRIGITILD